MVRTAVEPPSLSELREMFGLSRERMARLFDVSAKTIERWEARPAPPDSASARRRLAELQEIATLGRIVYTADGFRYFLVTPFPTFNGRTALQMIELGEADQVFGALAADYEGLGS